MILSISDSRAVRPFWSYVAITVFCIVFGLVYESYSHGVFSLYMVGMFLIPLLFGVLPCALIRFGVFPAPPALSRRLWRSGVAALIPGCCLTGVFEIYGSAAPLVTVYWVVGALFCAAGAIGSLLRRAGPE